MNEHFLKWYEHYPRKEGKGQAVKAWDRLTKTMSDEDKEKFLQICILAIDAQKRYRRQAEAAGDWQADWKMPSTWLNGYCWDDEIPSHLDIKKAPPLGTCGENGCPNKIHGPKFTKCAYHLSTSSENFQALRDFYKSKGLGKKQGESRDEWLNRLKECAKTYMSRMNKI